MKIAFVSWEFPPQFGGGIGTYVAAMSRLLARRGHEVTVITIASTAYPSRESLDGLEIIRLPVKAGYGPEPVASLRCWQGRADAVHALLSRLRDLDVIEFADYRGEGVTFLTATQPTDRPVCVVKLHTALNVLHQYNPSRIRYGVLESYEEQALLAADRLVSPSAALMRHTQELVKGVGPIDLLPYPADPAFLAYSTDGVEPAEEILYVGRLEERKGVETLIQAAPAVLEACPGAVLHLIGGDLQVSTDVPSMKARLIGMLPREYRPRVVFHDPMPREALVERYARARVCVFPSHFENFPNTCLEAMALGRPIVGTDNSGMAEMLEEGVSGRITRAADTADLTRVLIELYQASDSSRQSMGQAARDRIRQIYHPETVAQQFETLYDGYVSAHRRHSLSSSAHRRAGRRAISSAERPEVAVVIPCYNHGRFIDETITSVRDQDWPKLSCVIVDDGSTDPHTCETLARLERNGMRVVRQANQGLSAARNTGVRATDCPFYVALDADDRIAPSFISRLVEPLLRDATLGYCYSQVEFFGAASGVWGCEAYSPRRLMVQNLSVATAVVRRAAFDLVGGYSRDMVHGFEDWDFWLALLGVGYHGHCVAEPLFFYRKHPRGQSMLDSTQRHRAEMVQQMVQHHRALFASMLEVSISDKDAMFFEAHMQAFHLKEAAAFGQNAGAVGDSEIYRNLVAQAQLDYIENSKSWQLVQRLKENAAYRALARWRYGPEWRACTQSGSPVERLERIRRSRSYRLIQVTKRTPIYRWHARRKYGPDYEKILAEGSQH